MRKFPKQELCDRLDMDDYVSDVRKGASRWTEQRRMVFLADDGKHYAADYERGLTEMQDTSPFEGGPDEIECQEVEAYERTVRDWRVLPDQVGDVRGTGEQAQEPGRQEEDQAPDGAADDDP